MNQNPHKILKDANLKDFINMERYFMGKPAIFNKYYQTNLLQIIDKLPDLNQEERQKYAMQNNVNLMRKKKVIKKQIEEQNNFEEILLKNVTLAYKHQTDRLNQDLQINQFSFTGLLGRGAHSVVRLCKSSKQQNQIYACKILWFDKIRKKYFIRQKQLIDMVNNEIVLLNQLRHPHIIKAKEAIYLKQKQRLFLILEYCSKGPINKLINNSLTIEDKEWWQIVRKYFCQFVSAMKFMHQNNIIHRDIKPQNLLIDQNDQLKIIDFNVSQRLNKGESKIKITNKFIGTKGYAAPQLILDLDKEKFCDCKKIDVWAMAITLIELLERRHPYPVKTLPQLIKVLHNYKLQSLNDQNSSNQKKKGLQDNSSERLFINPEYPKELRNLLSKMLQYENQKRIGVQQIFQHPWIKNNR